MEAPLFDEYSYDITNNVKLLRATSDLHLGAESAINSPKRGPFLKAVKPVND
jgi:hypothetical protein